MTVHLTPRARDGLLGVIASVDARFGTTVAERVLARIERAFERLAAHPHLGHRRPELCDDTEIRFWSVGPTLIAYRDAGTRVDVLPIARAGLDWERMLERE